MSQNDVNAVQFMQIDGLMILGRRIQSELDRIFDELKWMPEWSEIKVYLDAYRSPEASMIRRARLLIRRGVKKPPIAAQTLDQKTVDALPRPLLDIGLKNGFLIEEDGKIIEAKER